MIHLLSLDALSSLLATLIQDGYRVIGPVRNGETVSLGDVADATDIPAGLAEEQSPGRYRLQQNGHGWMFATTVGAMNWKRFLFPPERTIVAYDQNGSDRTFAHRTNEKEDDDRPLAFLGVRPCDLAALKILDTVFLPSGWPDPYYRRQRERLFVVAVNCTHPGATCFCSSVGTGPEATSGYDILLTELTQREDHPLLAVSGTERGAEVLTRLGSPAAEPSDVRAGDQLMAEARTRIGRSVDTEGLEGILAASYDIPRWEEVAKRCLTCGNCTMVCPTCFCSTFIDQTDLPGTTAIRTRRWDSCFTLEHSYIHGGSVRQSGGARYRQWLTHKFGTWHRQFGSSGCVGCGRCIVWCPVGIDVTQELSEVRRAVRGSGPAAIPKTSNEQNANHKERIDGIA